MIERLFARGVCVASGAIEDAAALHPDEEPLAREMGPARRREFAAGRACARRALGALGFPPAPVLRGARRAPRWPEGVVGSITHRAGFCAAAVARAAEHAGVGIDVEKHAPLSARALARICSLDEIEALRALGERAPELWGSVVFSAKETLYKAYFPITEVFIGFRDAEIALHPEDAANGRFEARLVRADAPDAAGRRAFAGRFTIGAERIATGLAIDRA